MQISFFQLLVRIYCDALFVCAVWLWMVSWPLIGSGLTTTLASVRKKRTLHPQTPCDCPACSAKHKQCEITRQRVIPSWSAQHSGRGRPKRVETEGHSCNNPACVYFQVIDSHVHALVGCATHHRADAIQYFKCQACGTKVTGRWRCTT